MEGRMVMQPAAGLGHARSWALQLRAAAEAIRPALAPAHQARRRRRGRESGLPGAGGGGAAGRPVMGKGRAAGKRQGVPGSRSGTVSRRPPLAPLPCCCLPLHALQPHLDHAPAGRVRLPSHQG